MSWLQKHTKSLLTKTVITVTGNKNGESIPIRIQVIAYELDYGPVIHLTIKTDVKYKSEEDWSDHPFHFVKELENGNAVKNIIDDTPAVRALIIELAESDDKKLYTTTLCSHKGRLIRALSLFWS